MHVTINLVVLTTGGILMISLRLHLVFRNLESWVRFLLDRKPEVGYFQILCLTISVRGKAKH